MPNYKFSLSNFLVFISQVQPGPFFWGDESIAVSETTSKGTFPPPFALRNDSMPLYVFPDPTFPIPPFNL